MIFKVLKKDFQRNRTMNFILFLFVLLSAMFIGASVKNVTVLTDSLERFFQMAGVWDYYIFLEGNEQSEACVKEWLTEEELADQYEYSDSVIVGTENMKKADGTSMEWDCTTVICGQDSTAFSFFDEKDEKLEVQRGEIYLPRKFWEDNHLEKGDMLTFQYQDYEKTFVAAGCMKDAIMGSNMMGTKRMLIHKEDYQELLSHTKFMRIAAVSIKTEDTKQIEQNFSRLKVPGVMTQMDRETVKTTYVFDVIISLVLMVVSLCLILIAMLLLRFTIGVTIQEETREIGILKAIGIRDGGIRSLYGSKYMVLSLAGAIPGFVCSIFFGNLFLKEAAQNIVMQTGRNKYFPNFICAVAVVAFVTGFAYHCTGKLKKVSSINAIRGENGEGRFSRKGVFRLHQRTGLPAVLFLSCNDILSNLKKYFLLLFTFALGLLLIIVPVNALNTLDDDGIVTGFGMQEAEIFMRADEEVLQIVSHRSNEYVKEYLSNVQEKLAQNGIEAEVSLEITYNFSIAKGEKDTRSMAMQGVGMDAADYSCIQGDTPRQHNEVMLTKRTADKIGAVPGDTVIISMIDGDREYLVSGLYQSMMNMGEGIRFHQEEIIDANQMSGYFGIQIKLQDDYNERELNRIRDKIADIFPDLQVERARDYINNMIGGIGKYMERLRNVIVFVVICINILISVLMVKTFITKERPEISLLKSIGFSNYSLMWWQGGRIGILVIASSLLGIFLSGPMSQLTMTPIFRLMGAEHVDFVIRPFETFVTYPLLLLAVTLAASLFAALDVCRIPTNQINNME